MGGVQICTRTRQGLKVLPCYSSHISLVSDNWMQDLQTAYEIGALEVGSEIKGTLLHLAKRGCYNFLLCCNNSKPLSLAGPSGVWEL